MDIPAETLKTYRKELYDQALHAALYATSPDIAKYMIGDADKPETVCRKHKTDADKFETEIALKNIRLCLQHFLDEIETDLIEQYPDVLTMFTRLFINKQNNQ